MDTKHMEYFKAVYEERSIHAAAKKLFEEKQVRETVPYSLVFDYRHRDPLNHSAKVTALRRGTWPGHSS